MKNFLNISNFGKYYRVLSLYIYSSTNAIKIFNKFNCLKVDAITPVKWKKVIMITWCVCILVASLSAARVFCLEVASREYEIVKFSVSKIRWEWQERYRRKKKSLAQEVPQKRDILERRSRDWKRLCPLQPLLCNTATGSLRNCKGSSYTKNEYTFFLSEIGRRVFFIQQFFRKKPYFLRKLWKTVLGAHLTIFQGKEASCAKN